MTYKRTSWQIQKSVIYALFLRELKTRFGDSRLGYFWLLLEPVLHILFWTFLFFAVDRQTVGGIDIPVFIITGIVPWLYFSNTFNRSLNAISSNQGLYYYRQVKPIDTIWARQLLETIILIGVYFALLAGAGWLGWNIHIYEPLQVFLVLIVFAFFTTGIGLLVAVIGELLPETKRFFPFVLRPFYFISGIFFSLEALPPEIRHWLLFNPILHAIELSRDAFSSSFIAEGASLTYLAFCALVANFLALSLYYNYRFRLVAS